MKSQVPVFSLEGSGMDSFEIHHIVSEMDHVRSKQAHRDTNFILGYQQGGACEVVVDFKKIAIVGPATYCILPGQIHHGTSLIGFNAWILAIDGALLDAQTRQLLIDASINFRPVALTANQNLFLEQSFQLLDALTKVSSNDLLAQVQRKMLDTCVSIFTSIYKSTPTDDSKMELRASIITRSFLSLVLQNFRGVKSPRDYACKLNISTTYLNDVVKDTTGFAVSYWIRQEVIMEAKRLLYYTDFTVKEIAINLGYSDNAYFIRLFRKTTGEPPLRFREKSRVKFNQS